MKLSDSDKLELRESLDPDAFRAILKCMDILIIKEKDLFWSSDATEPSEYFFRAAASNVSGMRKLRQSLKVMMDQLRQGEK